MTAVTGVMQHNLGVSLGGGVAAELGLLTVAAAGAQDLARSGPDGPVIDAMTTRALSPDASLAETLALQIARPIATAAAAFNHVKSSLGMGTPPLMPVSPDPSQVDAGAMVTTRTEFIPASIAGVGKTAAHGGGIDPLLPDAPLTLPAAPGGALVYKNDNAQAKPDAGGSSGQVADANGGQSPYHHPGDGFATHDQVRDRVAGTDNPWSPLNNGSRF